MYIYDNVILLIGYVIVIFSHVIIVHYTGCIEEIFMIRRSSGKLVISDSDQILQIRVNIMYRWA